MGACLLDLPTQSTLDAFLPYLLSQIGKGQEEKNKPHHLLLGNMKTKRKYVSSSSHSGPEACRRAQQSPR